MSKDLIKWDIYGEDTYKCIFNIVSTYDLYLFFHFISNISKQLPKLGNQEHSDTLYIFLNVKITNLMGLADVLYLMFFPLNLFL